MEYSVICYGNMVEARCGLVSIIIMLQPERREGIFRPRHRTQTVFNEMGTGSFPRGKVARA
jgi:hypothetical protein